MKILEITNLHVAVDGTEILKGVNLTLKAGTIVALMGPNGSGKSTLANVLMGHPNYVITKGQIVLDGEDITGLAADAKAKKGIFLSFQYPKEISGVTILNFLRTAHHALKGGPKMPIFQFQKIVKEKAALLNANDSFFTRYVNEGFSGGEKKKAEILQMLTLDPAVAILDETDSGLDIDALKTVAQGVKHFMAKDKCILVITHYKRILEYLKPDHVSVLSEGAIVLDGGVEIIDKLETEGYAWTNE